MSDPMRLLTAAVADTAPTYAKVTVDDLDRPTPCEGWDLRTLLNHVISRFVLSTRAAELTATPDFAAIEIDYVGAAPAGAFDKWSREMLLAWKACEDFTTERVTPVRTIPAEGVLVFGAQDVFIHAWDVAKTLGVEPELSDEMIEVFTATHHQTVDEEIRSAFFASEIAVADDAAPIDQLVAFLGRQP